MRDFDSFKQTEMGIIENRVRHIYNKGYEDGLKDGKESVQINETEAYLMDTENAAKQFQPELKRAYNDGMNDAWNAARKIICDDGNSLKSEQIIEIFGCGYFYEIFNKYSASEVIAKIKEWEENQKQDDDEIKVGDEVLNKWGTKGIVIEIAPQHNGATVYSVLWRNAERRCLDKSDWDSYEVWKKTGRHFPEIADVLRKMKEGEG